MLETAFFAGIVGFGLGFVAGRRPTAAEKPLQLVSVHSFEPPAGLQHSAAQVDQWPLYTTAFCFHANLLGSFSYRSMAAAGVVRRAAWECYTGILKDAGVIQAVPRSTTAWAGGWCYSKLRVELKHKRLALAYPAGNPPALNSAKISTLLTQAFTAQASGAGGTP